MKLLQRLQAVFFHRITTSLLALAFILLALLYYRLATRTNTCEQFFDFITDNNCTLVSSKAEKKQADTIQIFTSRSSVFTNSVVVITPESQGYRCGNRVVYYR